MQEKYGMEGLKTRKKLTRAYCRLAFLVGKVLFKITYNFLSE